MYSEEYEAARKEFINCLWMGLIGMGVPFYLAFKYWKPIMKAESVSAPLRRARSRPSDQGIQIPTAHPPYMK